MGKLAGRLFKSTVDLLFPPQCVGCGHSESFLCATCQQSLPRLELPFCSTCAQPLAHGAPCQRCSDELSFLDGTRSLFLMEGAVREAIHRLKYNDLRALAPLLGGLMAEYLRENPVPAEVVTPVPLHPRRLRKRGYNQSYLLAREVGKLLDLPVMEKALARTKDAPSQTSSSIEDRLRNVEGAFTCGDRVIEGRQVLLIDDVCTTGSTLKACAQALKSAGAGSVWALVVAREG